MVGVHHLHGGGGEPFYVVALWMCVSTMMIMLSFSACAWHRRRMQRRREGFTLTPPFLAATPILFLKLTFSPFSSAVDQIDVYFGSLSTFS